MLLTYEFSNFKSVGPERVCISFEPVKDKTRNTDAQASEVGADIRSGAGSGAESKAFPKTRALCEDNIIRSADGQYSALKGCFIYGNNGTGKSTILLSLNRLQQMILHSFYEYDEKPRNMKHFLYRNEPCFYHVRFTKDFNEKTVLYDYIVVFSEEGITKEKLSYSPNGRTVVVFERTSDSENEEYSYGPRFEEDIKKCEGFFRPFKLALGVIANATKQNEASPADDPIHVAYKYLGSSIIEYLNERGDRFYDIEKRIGKFLTEEHPEYKDLMVELMRKDGFDIQDIIIRKEEISRPRGRYIRHHRFSDDDFFEENEDSEDSISIEYRVFLKHPQFDNLPILEESKGTLNLIRLIIAFTRVMSKDRILLCDEPETSMHPNLIYNVIKYFMDSGYNTNSQILCVTHETRLLDIDNLLRRDQIYLTDMNPKDRTTVVKRLPEIGDVRKTDNVEKKYLEGKYKVFKTGL